MRAKPILTIIPLTLLLLLFIAPTIFADLPVGPYTIRYHIFGVFFNYCLETKHHGHWVGCTNVTANLCCWPPAELVNANKLPGASVYSNGVPGRILWHNYDPLGGECGDTQGYGDMNHCYFNWPDTKSMEVNIPDDGMSGLVDHGEGDEQGEHSHCMQPNAIGTGGKVYHLPDGASLEMINDLDGMDHEEWIGKYQLQMAEGWTGTGDENLSH